MGLNDGLITGCLKSRDNNLSKFSSQSFYVFDFLTKFNEMER